MIGRPMQHHSRGKLFLIGGWPPSERLGQAGVERPGESYWIRWW
ncbi:hypothetical protein ALON55S_04885 [Alishewanella longhuensis]